MLSFCYQGIYIILAGPSSESNAKLMARKFCYYKQPDATFDTLQLLLSSHLLESSSECGLQNLEGKSLINIQKPNDGHAHKKERRHACNVSMRRKKCFPSAKSLVFNRQLHCLLGRLNQG